MASMWQKVHKNKTTKRLKQWGLNSKIRQSEEHKMKHKVCLLLSPCTFPWYTRCGATPNMCTMQRLQMHHHMPMWITVTVTSNVFDELGKDATIYGIRTTLIVSSKSNAAVLNAKKTSTKHQIVCVCMNECLLVREFVTCEFVFVCVCVREWK